jgi:drug/metabolite transporter (DMT)-like permease
MTPVSENSRAYLAIGTAMVSVSFASVLIVWSESSPLVIATYRLAFTCALLAPYLIVTGGFSEIARFDRREVLLVVLSGVALAFHFGLWIVSLTLTLVASSVILVTSHPMFVAAVSHFLLKERVRKAAVAGIVIAFSGVVIIFLSGYDVSENELLGDVLAFLGGICAGIYFLSGRVARQSVAVAPYSFSVYGISASILFVGAIVAGDAFMVTDPRELTLFVLMAVVPTILGHTMLNYALKTVPAHVISASVLAEPVGASLLAYLLLEDQIPGPYVIAGGALVILGLYIVIVKGYQRSAERAPIALPEE